jgi:acetyl-CoA C-acetyltransferase
MSNIVIVGAARTPVGSFLGSLASTAAHELGAIAIKAALDRSGVAAREVDEVIMGQVLSAGQGMNPARQAALRAGVGENATAWGINQVCGSGLRAVALGMQQLITDDAGIVVAGGQESMSLSPHCQNLRQPSKMGSIAFVDTMLSEGLTDAMGGYHMGITAENVARQFDIGREEQDTLALHSQRKASAAQLAGRFDAEICSVPVTTRGMNTFAQTRRPKAWLSSALRSTRTALLPQATPQV